jgi:ubiquinone/menaquinone biosynthesis C-methylase UbiE
MAFSKEEIRELYRKRAKRYDITANLYYLLGFRETKYRKMAISRLGLKPGDITVEIGCGSGHNFTYVQHYIGETGHLIGVDLTDAMLRQAQSRIEKHGWKNIRLVESEAARYSFPDNINGVFSTFALTLIPEYQTIIEEASKALVDSGRLVLLDLKKPQQWPLWLVKFGVAISRPFGVTLDIADRRPWEAMEPFFRKVTVIELYGGFVYIAVGEK